MFSGFGFGLIVVEVCIIMFVMFVVIVDVIVEMVDFEISGVGLFLSIDKF